MESERRASKRHAVSLDEIEALVLPGKEVCRVRTISTGGVAIEYTPAFGKLLKSESIHLLTQSGCRCSLQNLQCRTVYDIPTLMEGRSFRGRKRRIRGLNFVALTKSQKTELDQLLRTCFGPAD